MALVKTAIWDMPIRIFHWTLVLAVVAAIISAKIGGDYIVWHGRLGLLVIALLVFRLIWGFAGSYTARFTQFFPNPASIKAYLQGTWSGIGHNPLGAISVFAILSVLIIQASSGLFISDDIAYQGYLASFVSEQCSSLLGEIHEIGEKLIFLLIFLHLAAIFFYQKVKKHNLIKPMLTGQGDVEQSVVEQIPPSKKKGSLLILIIAIFFATATVVIIANAQNSLKSILSPPAVKESKQPSW